jgi:predicted phage gp36 major capsid-like protein
MNIQEPTISEVLFLKLDDNKYEGHEGTVWKMNGKTMMQIRSDRDGRYLRRDGPNQPVTIMGLGYEIDHSMNDGEIELKN